MAKYIKFYIETDRDIHELTASAREYAKANFDNFKMYAWDTNNTDDYIAAFSDVKSCGKFIGKTSERELVCGVDDYLCPECKKQR